MPMVYDATAAMSFVVSQAAHIETEVNETVYPDIQYQELVPVDTGANPFARTVTYFSGDRYGAAKWINGNADDIPLAGSELNKHETSVYTAAIGYGYGWEEINAAQQLGVRLENTDALAARRAYEEFVDAVALRGSAEKGYRGLMDHPGVIVQPAPGGDWDNPATSAETILGDVNAALMGIAIGTLFTSSADTLLMSHGRLQILAYRVIPNTSETLLSFIARSNYYTQKTGRPLRLRGVIGLETAGVGGTERMVAYRRAPEVLKLHIPMPHRFLPVWQAGPLRWEVPGVFRLGGLDIRRPLEVRYVDGI